MAARRQVTIFINGKEVENQLKSINAEKKKLIATLNQATIGSKEYNEAAAELRKVNDIITEHNKRIRGVEGAWTKITGGAMKFFGAAGIAFGVAELVSFGKELATLGTEMDTLGRKAETVFGEALPLVTEAAKENAAAMGLTISSYTDAATAIGDLLIPMGFQREEAAAISTNLVNLSGALAEWTGGQKNAEEVTEILSKAMLGEREQLKSLGIAISEYEVSARLAEKGLDKLTGKTLQQAKAAATLELITEKSADAQTAFAENSDSLIRKQAEISSKFRDIKESLATALIPVFERLLKAATPIIESFADFVTQLTSSQTASSKTGAVLKVLGLVFENLWKVLKAVYGTFVDVGAFLLKTLSPVLEFVGEKFLEFYNLNVRVVNGIAGLLGAKWKLEAINIEEFKRSLSEAEKALEKSKVAKPIGLGGGMEDAAAAADRQKAADEAAKQRAKEAERELKDLQTRAKKLREAVGKIQEDDRIAALEEGEKRIEQIRRRYAEEIKEAVALEQSKNKAIAEAAAAQRIELERLQAEAIRTEREKIFQEELEAAAKLEDERTAAELERFFKAAEARKEAETTIAAALREAVLGEQEKALLDLEEYYNNLTLLAQKNGIDTLDLEIAYRKQREKILQEFDKKEIDQLAKSQAERAQLLQESYQAIGDVIQGVIDIAGTEGTKYANLQKGLTLAQIAIDTAAAIAALTRNSEANPANAVTFGAAGAIQFATGLARILTNIAKAKTLLSEAKVPQRKAGGYATVRGEDDNRLYTARLIGQPVTGLLDHPGPVLTASGILANEAGREYYVSHHDLRNPAVINHVQAIENIVKHRQMQAGGFATPTPPATNQPQAPAPPDARMTQLLDLNVQVLLELIRRGVHVQLDDNTLIAMQRRMGELVKVSGGRAF